MKNKKAFRAFTFFPRRLAEERMKLEKKYQSINEEILKKYSGSKLPELLEKIRALPMDRRVLQEFAQTLSALEIRLLAFSYPVPEEEKAIRKIAYILMAGYNHYVGRRMWNVFQNRIHDSYAIQLLQHAFERENETFLGLDSEARTQLNQAFQTKEPLEHLSGLLVHSTQNAQTTLRRWKVHEGSLLERTLIYQMLLKSIDQNQIIERETLPVIVKYLDEFTLDKYRNCLKIYLESRTEHDFDRPLIKQAIKKLGDPRRNESPWHFLQSETLQAVKRYLNRLDLKNFFAHDRNNERFLYWERYLNEIESLDTPEPSILCMNFGQFVVVEFANKGNAVYFYHREGFEAEIVPKIYRFRGKVGSKKYLFKVKREYAGNLPLYINSLGHLGGSWQDKFDRYMNEYLRGNFAYSESKR